MAVDVESDGGSIHLTVQWRRILKDIDEDLDSQEVAAMCFLCRDNVPGAKLEKVSRGLELLNELETKGLVSSLNSQFLLELLYRVGRLDLLRKFNHNIGNVQAEIQKSGSCFSPFRLLLQYFCDEMNNDEVQSMKFLAGSYVAKNKLQDVETAQNLFVILEKAQVVVPEDMLVLKEMTGSLDRRDLFDKIMDYEALRSGIPPMGGFAPPPAFGPAGTPPMPTCLGEKMGFPSMGTVTPMSSYNDPPPPYTPPLTPRRDPVGLRPPKQASVVQDLTPDRSLTPPIDSGPNKAQLAAQLQREAEDIVTVRQMHKLQLIRAEAQRTAQSNTRDISRQSEALKKEMQKDRERATKAEEQIQRSPLEAERLDMPCYKMDAKPRGICVIINNRDFYKITGDPRSKSLPKREGTDIDCKNLGFVWKKLEFHVETFHNLTETGISRTLAHYAFRVDHTNFDCFVCCVLTHGMFGGIYGVNGRFLEIKDLTSVFKAVQCPSLAGKPKLFFLQACQGKSKQRGIRNFEADDDTEDAVEEDAPPDFPPETIPNEADFLLGYATIPGFVSYRSRSMGSWYITKLVEMLSQYADKYDLLSILIKVNEEVSKAVAQVEDQMYKQSPAPMPTLRKKIYFK